MSRAAIAIFASSLLAFVPGPAAAGTVFGVAGIAPGAAGTVAGAAGAGDPFAVSGWAAVGALILGTVVLLTSVEVLVRALVRTAMRFRVSVFLLAVVFSGFEFDNVAFGLFTGFRNLQQVSFGLAIGNAISIFGLVFALGALLYPFEIDVPRDYLLMMLAGPLVLLPFILAGRFTRLSGVLLGALAVVVFAYIYYRERESDRTFMQADEVRDAVAMADGQFVGTQRVPARLRRIERRVWFWPAVLVVALGGVIVGAEVSATGVEGMVQTWNLTGTILGTTLVTLFYTMDDLLLAIEPLRLGYYDIALGGIIGSLLFFVTANVGIVAMVGTVDVGPATLYLHFPTLVGMTALSGFFLWRGTVKRWHGALLIACYLAYLAVNVYLLSTVPVSG